MRILIVGNIIKDVYLNLDESQNHFETDENGTPWMDVAFNGSYHSFFTRTSVFSGSAITLEVFKKMGIDASISGTNFGFDNNTEVDGESPNNTRTSKNIADSYRYILSTENKVAYLTSSDRIESKFVAPNFPVDWIFVDCSAEITDELTEKIKNYLGISKTTKLAVFASSRGDTFKVDMRLNINEERTINDNVVELVKIANLIFTDGKIDIPTNAAICYITNREVRVGNLVRRYNHSKGELITHLTARLIISATIIGAMAHRMTAKDALELAVINVENSKITETLTFEKMKKIMDERHEKADNLRYIAKSMVAAGKGILAADESGGSIHKKFEQAGIPDDEQHRRDYRNIFFTTEDLEKYVNGVILFDETARQKADDGSDFVSFLTAKQIIPGIKVDQGLESFSDEAYANEKWTKGLDDLPERLAEYYEMGARFAKWRAAFEVTDTTPSDFAIQENCKILARYALDCQNAGIVPIVEPELVHDGDYSIETCANITGRILDELFTQLKVLGVNLEGCVLKTNMVLAGKQFESQSTPEEVGKWTAKVLLEHCPKELAGVVFLSGGQGVEQATDNLQAVTNNGPFPWPVTFSFARALQGPALDAWKGDNNNADAAREAFKARLIANCKALRKNRLN
jgi:fructose-bisphosphate aldolase class I